MSEQRGYCKRFLALYRLRLNQNFSRELAWASASPIAGREHAPEAAEREEVAARLRRGR